MKIIDTNITEETLSGSERPQLKIANKLYTVDDRQSTFDKIEELQTDKDLSEKQRTEKIYEYALGKEAAKEIAAMDLSVENKGYLMYCIMGAITGESPDELRKLAKERIGKN